MMTDPIADMLSRIRNAATARHETTEVPLSKLKARLAQILKDEGYITDFRINDEFPQSITITLKYGRDREPAILGVRRRSRPGLRYYVGHTEIPRIRNGLGVAILSTSKGVMTDRTARAEHVGGEVLCEVW